MRNVCACLLAAWLVAACSATPPTTDTLRISIVGTNDVHGVLLPEDGRGGLATLSGYVSALRDARAADGGAVLLIDAGDMWQGTLESNLNEGAAVVDAYNAMRYTTAAVGNHEFDFGPAGSAPTPRDDADDPRGNIKDRARQMQFPLLAANLRDSATGEQVDWENVRPSILLDVQGIGVGVIGVMTERALITTIASNVVGLEVESLLSSVTREAQDLREEGAQIVIVTAHAGSRCEEFADPYDLSSCSMNGEIMRLANALPKGLVDHIVSGHTHQNIAHVVNGISITSGVARTVTFGRTDIIVDRETGKIIDRQVFPPRAPCPYSNAAGSCAWSSDTGIFPAYYEGRQVVPQAEVLAIAKRALAAADDKINEELGAILATPFDLAGNPESALGNLFTDAVLAMTDGDIAIHNVSGGIRDTLPAGPLTFGSVYGAFPFDNRIVILDLRGSELRDIIAAQAHKRRRAGFSGMRVFVSCEADVLDVRMQLNDGRFIADDDTIAVVVNDFLALGGDDILTPIIPAGGIKFGEDQALTRDALVEWFRLQDGFLHADQYLSTDAPRWNLPDALPESCALSNDG